MVKKTIKVGADPFPPYQYFDTDGNIQGSDYRHVKTLFESLGYEISITLKEWSDIEKMIDERLLDAAFQVQKNTEREGKYAFSSLLRNAETQVLTSKQSLTLDSMQDLVLQKCTIGLIEGYAYGNEIDCLPSANKKFYLSNLELLLGISNGEVDVGCFDKGVKEYLMEQNGINNIYSLDNLNFIRPLYVIFHDTCLRDEFNSALDAE